MLLQCISKSSFFLLTVFRIYFSGHPVQSAPHPVKWSAPSLHPDPHPIPHSHVPHPQCLPSAEHIRTGKDPESHLTPLPLRHTIRSLPVTNVDQTCRVAPVRLAAPFNSITSENMLMLSGWLQHISTIT